MTAIQLWWLALAVGAVVMVVVAVLLGMIIAAAKSIDRHAESIWAAGKQIAGNTVSIWMLDETNARLQRVQQAVHKLEQTAASMKEHLQGMTAKEG